MPRVCAESEYSRQQFFDVRYRELRQLRYEEGIREGGKALLSALIQAHSTATVGLERESSTKVDLLKEPQKHTFKLTVTS